MINKLNVLIFSFVTTITLATSEFAYGSEMQCEGAYSRSPTFGTLPIELRHMVVTEAAILQVLGNHPLGNLVFVTKEWHQIVKIKAQAKEPLWKVLQGVANEQDEAIYQAFITGKLVYRPTPDKDDGKIEFNISDFLNPFKGTFDLSLCGNASQDIIITTDPSIFFLINKAQPICKMLIAPHFLIKKYITSSTKFFEPIMADWDAIAAPVGIFWRWSGWDDLSSYDHQSSESLSMMSSKNLFEILSRVWASVLRPPEHVRDFMLIFNPK